MKYASPAVVISTKRGVTSRPSSGAPSGVARSETVMTSRG